jgi:tetratricopeptide (TPR) repeat protein
MPVNTELARPETEDDFEAMCCLLYQLVYRDPGLMRVGGSGQGQFGVDLLGADRRSVPGISVGIQCKHYVAKKFTLTTVTDDVAKADEANLAIEHLMFATTAPPSADIVRKVHELSEQRRKQGKFSVSVEYWSTLQAHIRMFPEVGRAYIPGFPGGALLDIRDNVIQVLSVVEEQTSVSQHSFQALQTGQAGQTAILKEILATVVAPSARSLTPDPKGDEADPGVVASLNFVRDRLREGRTRDARRLLDELGDPTNFRDSFSRFRWHTNAAAVELLEGRTDAAAEGFLNVFDLARDNEKAHINRAHAYFLQKKVETSEVACEEALAKFPLSAPLWGMRLHIRSQLGKDPEDGKTPQDIREKPDYLFSLARIRANAGDRATAVSMLKRCIALDGGSIDGRRAYLAEALMWVGTDNVSAFLGQIPEERRAALTDALRQFEPLEETLAAVQSVHLSEELATNVTSSLTVLGELPRARSVALQLLGRHPDLEQLLRTRLVELAESKNLNGLKTLAGGSLDSLPASAIALLAEASANLGDVEWNAEILSVAARRAENDIRLREVAPLTAVAAWRSGDQQLGLRRIQDYVTEHPNHVMGRVIAAHLFESAGKAVEARVEAQACIALLPEQSKGADVLQVADLLGDLDMHSEAAGLYERFIEAPRADELTIKWLQCLVASDQRRKAQLTLEKMTTADRKQHIVRHIEVNLAAKMMDWRRMRDLLALDLGAGALRPDVALGYGTALYRLNEMEQLKEFAASDPILNKARVDQELEFSKLQVAAGLPQIGLKRLFALFRKHPNNVRVAGILLGQVLMAKSVEALAVPPCVEPGSAVELRAGGERWWVALDAPDAGPAETWPELVAPSAPVAQELMGAGIGETRVVTRGITTLEAEVLQVTSLFAFALQKAHELIATKAGPHGPVWSVRVMKEDGRVDIDALLQQARKRREHVESAFALYRERRIPIGLLARLLGSDPITLLLEWPYKEMSLFIGIGSEDERQTAFAAIRQNGQRFVTDLFTIAEMILRKTGPAVVATIGRPLIPEAQRQNLLEIMQELPGQRAVSMQEHGGRLRIIELSDAYHRHRTGFLQAILTFIDEHCDVVATAGPENQSKELRELVRVLDEPSGECVLLCLERDAALLSEDGGFRLLAGGAGVTKASGLQPVWMVACEQRQLDAKTYAESIAAKILANHDFVSVNGRDLMQLASADEQRIHPAVRAALETFKRPTLEILSGVRVCVEFLGLAVRRLPPAIAGHYAKLAISALLHGRAVRRRVFDRVFASRISIFGRNGRRIPAHVRRLFGGVLSRQHLRR